MILFVMEKLNPGLEGFCMNKCQHLSTTTRYRGKKPYTAKICWGILCREFPEWGVIKGLCNLEDLSNGENLTKDMKGHACEDILLQKKFLLKVGTTPIRNKRKEINLDIGECMVTEVTVYYGNKKPPDESEVIPVFPAESSSSKENSSWWTYPCQTFFPQTQGWPRFKWVYTDLNKLQPEIQGLLTVRGVDFWYHLWVKEGEIVNTSAIFKMQWSVLQEDYSEVSDKRGLGSILNVCIL